MQLGRLASLAALASVASGQNAPSCCPCGSFGSDCSESLSSFTSVTDWSPSGTMLLPMSGPVTNYLNRAYDIGSEAVVAISVPAGLDSFTVGVVPSGQKNFYVGLWGSCPRGSLDGPELDIRTEDYVGGHTATIKNVVSGTYYVVIDGVSDSDTGPVTLYWESVTGGPGPIGPAPLGDKLPPGCGEVAPSPRPDPVGTPRPIPSFISDPQGPSVDGYMAMRLPPMSSNQLLGHMPLVGALSNALQCILPEGAVVSIGQVSFSREQSTVSTPIPLTDPLNAVALPGLAVTMTMSSGSIPLACRVEGTFFSETKPLSVDKRKQIAQAMRADAAESHNTIDVSFSVMFPPSFTDAQAEGELALVSTIIQSVAGGKVGSASTTASDPDGRVSLASGLFRSALMVSLASGSDAFRDCQLSGASPSQCVDMYAAAAASLSTSSGTSDSATPLFVLAPGEPVLLPSLPEQPKNGGAIAGAVIGAVVAAVLAVAAFIVMRKRKHSGNFSRLPLGTDATRAARAKEAQIEATRETTARDVFNPVGAASGRPHSRVMSTIATNAFAEAAISAVVGGRAAVAASSAAEWNSAPANPSAASKRRTVAKGHASVSGTFSAVNGGDADMGPAVEGSTALPGGIAVENPINFAQELIDSRV